MVGDRPIQSAYEYFAIECRFQQCKSRPPKFKKTCARRCQRGVPSKSGYFVAIGCSSVKQLQIDTDMLLILTGTGNELLRNVNINDLE